MTRKVKSDRVRNMYHPDFANKTEFAFEANGKKYYNFKRDTDMRYGRYIVMQTFLQEYYLRIDLETLKKDIQKLKSWLNPTINNGKGQLELGKSLELLSIMEQRANIAFEPDTVYRLASCLYFDDQEILIDYDRHHNEKKIAAWKEAKTTDFFFNKLFQDVTQLMVTSRDALISYLEKAPELTKGWRTMSDILQR